MSSVRRAIAITCTTLIVAAVAATPAAGADPVDICATPPQGGDTMIRSGVMAPDPIVVGPTTAARGTYTTVVTDSCPLEVGLSNFFRHDSPDSGEFIDPRDLLQEGTSDGHGTWTFTGVMTWDPKEMPNVYAGSWTPEMFAYGSGYDDNFTTPFSVLRAARLTTNATPEPVRKGRSVTIKGQLGAADWEAGAWVGYGNQPVSLQFRTPKGRYHSIRTVTSATSGAVRTKVTATKDGCYRYVFAGDATTASTTSKGDCVDVR